MVIFEVTKWNAPFHLVRCRPANGFMAMQQWQHAKKQIPKGQTRPTGFKWKFWVQNLGFMSTVSSSTNRNEIFVQKMENKHSIRTNTQCTSSFQHPFSKTRANKVEPSTNIFIYETLNPRISLNMQPFLSIQSSQQSWQRDLSNAYHSLANNVIQKITKSARQWWFSCCLVSNSWNRWSFQLLMMNGWDILA